MATAVIPEPVTSPRTTEELNVTSRDARVDILGMVNQVTKWAEGIKEKVKSNMINNKNTVVSGDQFIGKLVTGNSASVDPRKFLKLYKDGKITEAEFLTCIKVSKDAASKVVHPKDLARILGPAVETNSLRIEQINAAPINTQVAIEELVRTYSTEL